MSSTHRLESIDQYRGFAILLMVLANYLGHIHIVPAWLKHSPDVGLTVIDIIAPMFMFAIGLTYGLSARRRAARDGWRKAAEHFFRRFMALLGIGSLASAAGPLLGFDPGEVSWGVLQAIGTAGLLTLVVIGLPSWVRLVVGVVLLAGYQVLLDRYWLQQVFAAPHGGFLGSPGWAAMLILATVLADLFHDQTRRRSLYTWATLVTLTLGIGLSFFVPVSKNRVSASYVLVSLGLSGLLFAGFHLLSDSLRVRVSLLLDWGKNPLLLYVLHYALLGMVALPPIPAWYTEAPLWLVVLQAAAILGVLSWIGRFLARKGWYFAL